MKIDWSQGHVVPMDLPSFLALADDLYDPDNPSTAWNLRGALLSLAENKNLVWSLVLDAARRRLATITTPEQPTYYMLLRTPTFSLRATIWLPESSIREVRMMENGLFAYDYPHNHNFDLLTVNCLGRGYQTEIYEIEQLYPGVEKGQLVQGQHRGRFRLAPGTALFYEAGRDVHSQIPVEELTVALNFLPSSPSYANKPQYGFDFVSSNQLRVGGIPLSPERRETFFTRLLARLSEGGSDTEHLLAELAKARKGDSVADTAARMLDLLKSPGAVTQHVSEELRFGAMTTNYGEVSDRNRNRRVA